METRREGNRIPKSNQESCPHSLGTLIEWKLGKALIRQDDRYYRPHSLGTLIEWKR